MAFETSSRSEHVLKEASRYGEVGGYWRLSEWPLVDGGAVGRLKLLIKSKVSKY
jgi:hypothetical protein